MSKMQMLLFAVGIAVVVLLFYSFVSRVGLAQSASVLVAADAKLVSDQLGSDVPCTFGKIAIPDALYYGASTTPIFYDLEFSKTKFGSGGGNTQNQLILRVSEHSSSTKPTKNVLASKSVATDAEIVLIGPEFLQDLSLSVFDSTSFPVGGKDTMSLYPRAAGRTPEAIASSPNAFVALKSYNYATKEKTLYIIPCATSKEPNNCEMNILRTGCMILSRRGGASPQTELDSCFNITIERQYTDPTSGGIIVTSAHHTFAECSSLMQ